MDPEVAQEESAVVSESDLAPRDSDEGKEESKQNQTASLPSKEDARRLKGREKYDIIEPVLAAQSPAGEGEVASTVSVARQSKRAAAAGPPGVPSREDSNATETSEVGAISVPGIDSAIYGRDACSDLELGETSTVVTEGLPATVVAEAVTREDMEDELREQLRSQLREEVQAQIRSEAVVASVVKPMEGELDTGASQSVSSNGDGEKTPFWKNKRLLITSAVLLLAIIGIVVGTVVGTRDRNERGTVTVSPSGQELVGDFDNDRFGAFTVFSRDGTTLAVGADSGDYVKAYRFNGTQWLQHGEFINGTAANFGKAVDISNDGSTIIVGAWKYNAGLNGTLEEAGLTRVYRYNDQNDDWPQLGQTLLGDDIEDYFGWYVSVSDDGETIAVSARKSDPSIDRTDAGIVRVYINDNGTWKQLGSDMQGAAENDQMGRSLSLSSDGRKIAVSSVRGANNKGRIQVYDFNGTDWNPFAQSLDGLNDDDWQGTSVALTPDSSVIAVAADGTDKDGKGEVGLVRVYHLDGNGLWSQRGQNIWGEAAGDQLGAGHISLSDDGQLLALGSENHDNERGMAYLYQYVRSKWVKVFELKGSRMKDELGSTVTLSGDGSLFAAGAPQQDTKGDPPGYVRIYHVNR